MKTHPLGRSGLNVSEFCLGTMTWGSQNTEAEAHAQLEMATARGVTFIDTAEMYPTNPVRAETIGDTERILGRWLGGSGRARRDDLVIATKISGRGNRNVRDGAPISRAALVETVDAALARLQTDRIDLFQLHWPDRGSYHFRQNWHYDPSRQDRAATVAHMMEVLETLQGLIEAGKLRHVGLSNETAWGTALWLRLAEENGLPRMQSIQNEYSLLCRLFDTDLAELGVNEDVTLLGYSPLAAGLLSGKYAGGVTPEGSRRALSPELGGRVTPRVWKAVTSYLGVAREFGLNPVQMSLAWFRTRPFPVIPIIGATSLAQLDVVLGAANLVLTPEVVKAIESAHRDTPMPF